MSLLSSKKLTALSALLTSAGFSVETLLSAEDGTNPITDALDQAKTGAVAEFLKEVGIEAHEDGHEAAIDAYTGPFEEKATTAEARSKLLATAVAESLGIDAKDLDTAEDAEALKAVLDKAISTKTARQLASAGHEPLPVASNSDDVSDVEVMTLEEAHRALAAENDPAKYKKIYNRIVELEENSRN